MAQVEYKPTPVAL